MISVTTEFQGDAKKPLDASDPHILNCGRKLRDKNSEYPENLSDLVPDFINKIPVAKYTLASNRFFYISSKNSHMLFYTSLPPSGRPTYSFEKQAWAYMD